MRKAMQLVGNLIMSFKGAMSLCLLVLLLTIISTIIGRETHTKNGSQIKFSQAEYDAVDFDCVDIHKQPAFSHPLLKNHKIQMNPSFLENLRKNEVNPFNMADIGLKGEGCPSGKVPIQRKKANTSFHHFTSTYPGQHFATLQYSGREDIYHGARARINAYNPHVVDSQISAAYIWVQSGNLSGLNNIQAGWAVHPRLYGDNLTRITTYWTKDNFQRTGCYNMECSGFVQISRRAFLGHPVGTTSTYGGAQYVMDIAIKQVCEVIYITFNARGNLVPKCLVMEDQASGNWWIVINGKQMGYWPKEIFSDLQRGATHLQYGGWVFVSPNGNSPPMGNGHLPSDDYKRCCWFNHVKFVNSIYQEIDIVDNKANPYVDTKCYNIIYWGYGGSDNEKTFSFGGPGGQCGT